MSVDYNIREDGCHNCGYYANGDCDGNDYNVCSSWRDSSHDTRNWFLEDGYFIGFICQAYENFEKGYCPEGVFKRCIKEAVEGRKEARKGAKNGLHR